MFGELMNKNKKNLGNVEILFVTFFIIVLISSVCVFYILYTQINYSIYPIKQDLFYIVQNAYFSFDNKELGYYNYSINEEMLKEKIMFLLYKNHNGVCLESLKYDNSKNVVVIKVSVKIKPIILSSIIGDKIIVINEEVKLKNMEVIQN